MREKDDLDLLLDSALSSYADVHADSGLEQRVLNRISVAELAARPESAPHRRWLLWAIALPVAACLLLLVFTMKKARPHESEQQFQAHQTAQPAIEVPNEISPTRHEKSPQSTKIHPLSPKRKADTNEADSGLPTPKLDIFPTPTPLTPEEQAFANFVNSAPEPERRALIESQKQLDVPLNIAAIQIPPLEPPDTGTK
jgi:hypothetical protein